LITKGQTSPNCSRPWTRGCKASRRHWRRCRHKFVLLPRPGQIPVPCDVKLRPRCASKKRQKPQQNPWPQHRQHLRHRRLNPKKTWCNTPAYKRRGNPATYPKRCASGRWVGARPHAAARAVSLRASRTSEFFRSAWCAARSKCVRFATHCRWCGSRPARSDRAQFRPTGA